MKRVLFTLLAFGFSLGTKDAQAVEVYFNGVKVTGLKNQSFQNCAVQFDGEGNLHVAAKGYSVQRVDPPEAGVMPQPPSTAKIFMVVASTKPGISQYDVDIFVGTKWVRRVHSKNDAIIEEFDNKLALGPNVIRFVATKNLDGKPRLSTSSSEYLKIMIGEGIPIGEKVTITKLLAEFQASADKMERIESVTSFTLKAFSPPSR